MTADMGRSSGRSDERNALAKRLWATANEENRRMQRTRFRLAGVVAVGLVALSVSACGPPAGADGTVVAEAGADGTPATPPARADEPRPSATTSHAPLPDRTNAASTKHPDPCGVDNDERDSIERANGFSERPIDRVVAAAKEVFGGRYLGAYIANVEQQYGVGIGLYQLTSADEDAFFEATCFRRGDVVFEAGQVSGTQMAAWRAAAVKITSGKDTGGCALDPDWRTGTITALIKEGHPELREKLERAIPADNLVIKESTCPVTW